VEGADLAAQSLDFIGQFHQPRLHRPAAEVAQD
jgi:hypothetical protein